MWPSVSKRRSLRCDFRYAAPSCLYHVTGPIAPLIRWCGPVDAITFTSSSTVTNFCDVVGDLAGPQPLVVSIGPVTSKTAGERGLRVDAEAGEHTIEGLIAALVGILEP